MRIKTAALIAVIGLSLNIGLVITSRILTKMAVAYSDFESYRTAFEVMNWLTLITLQGSLLLLAASLYRSAR